MPDVGDLAVNQPLTAAPLARRRKRKVTKMLSGREHQQRVNAAQGRKKLTHIDNRNCHDSHCRVMQPGDELHYGWAKGPGEHRYQHAWIVRGGEKLDLFNWTEHEDLGVRLRYKDLDPRTKKLRDDDIEKAAKGRQMIASTVMRGAVGAGILWTQNKHPRGPGGRFRQTPDQMRRPIVQRERSAADLLAALRNPSLSNALKDPDEHFAEAMDAADEHETRLGVRFETGEHPGMLAGRITKGHVDAVARGVELTHRLFGRDRVNDVLNGAIHIADLSEGHNFGLSTHRIDYGSFVDNPKGGLPYHAKVQVDPVALRNSFNLNRLAAKTHGRPPVAWAAAHDAKDEYDAIAVTTVHEITHALHGKWEAEHFTVDKADPIWWEKQHLRARFDRHIHGPRALGGSVDFGYTFAMSRAGHDARVSYSLTNRAEFLAENMARYATGQHEDLWDEDTPKWVKKLAGGEAKVAKAEPGEEDWEEIEEAPYWSEPPTPEELERWTYPDDDVAKAYHPATHPRSPTGTFVSTGGRRPVFAHTMLVNQDEPHTIVPVDDDEQVPSTPLSLLVASDLVITKARRSTSRSSGSRRLSPAELAQRKAAAQASARARSRGSRQGTNSARGHKNYVGPARHAGGMIAVGLLGAATLAAAGKTFGSPEHPDHVVVPDPIKESYKDRNGRARIRWKDQAGTWAPGGRHLALKWPKTLSMRAAGRGIFEPGGIRPAIHLRAPTKGTQHRPMIASPLYGRINEDDDNWYYQAPHARDWPEAKAELKRTRQSHVATSANRGAFTDTTGRKAPGVSRATTAHALLADHPSAGTRVNRETSRRNPKTNRFTKPTKRLVISSRYDTNPAKLHSAGLIGPPHPNPMARRKQENDEITVRSFTAALDDTRPNKPLRTAAERKGMMARPLIEGHLTGRDAVRAHRALTRASRLTRTSITAAALLNRKGKAYARNQALTRAAISSGKPAKVSILRNATPIPKPKKRSRPHGTDPRKPDGSRYEGDVFKHAGHPDQTVHGNRPKVGRGGSRRPVGYKRGGRTGSVHQHHDVRGRFTTTGGTPRYLRRKTIIGLAAPLLAGALVGGAYTANRHHGGGSMSIPNMAPKPKTPGEKKAKTG